MNDFIYGIERAFVKSKLNGKRITKKALAAKIWPNTAPICRAVNMNNLVSGRTSTIRIEWVKIICEELDVTPNELFGYEK